MVGKMSTVITAHKTDKIMWQMKSNKRRTSAIDNKTSKFLLAKSYIAANEHDDFLLSAHTQINKHEFT